VRDPIIFRNVKCLTPDEALYWKDLLYRSVKIGTELEYALPKGARKDDILKPLTKDLQPSESLEHLGPYGVFDIESEHCGFEIRVIGRQPYYKVMLAQYRYILDKVISYGVRARATCGLHYHLLTVGLSEPVPQIILANLWNLVRKYAPSLKFFMSTGESMDSMCRRRNHNSHLEMVHLSPLSMSMQEIQQRLKKSRVVPEHQNFMNLEHVGFNSAGEVVPFHIEFRFPDADFSPVSIVAKTFLFLNLLLKAVEISQYGIIHVGQIREWQQKIKIMDLLSNNDGKLAASDTSGITPEMIVELQYGMKELLGLLKPIFARYENNPSYDVISFLSNKPVSILRARGMSWPEIITRLDQEAEIEPFIWDKVDRKLIQCIELVQLSGYSKLGDWKSAVAWQFYLSPKELEKRIAQYNSWRGVWWDASMGTLSFLT